MSGSRRRQWPAVGPIRGFGPGIVLEVAWALLSARPRSFASDARLVSRLMEPPPRVQGLEHVPNRGPFLLVANHYQRGEWWIGWVVAAITNSVEGVRDPGAREIRWVVLSEWRWFELFGRWIPNPVSALLFPRAARVWGLVTMPARPSDVGGRARAIRQVLAHMGVGGPDLGAHMEPAGFFPEGQASVELREALPGTGVLMQRVSNRGVPLLPVGVYLDDRGLVVRFGAPFLLGDPPGGGRMELDSWARERVMVQIGRLLPPRLWGPYSGAIGQDVERSSSG